MESIPTIARHEAIDRDEILVHDWRVTQLTRLGMPGLLAEGAASHVQLARNRQAGSARLPATACPPHRALRWFRTFTPNGTFSTRRSGSSS